MRETEIFRHRVVTIALLLFVPLLANLFPLATDWSADPRYFVSALSVGPQDSLLPGLPGWLDPHAGLTMQSLGGLAARDWLSGIIPWWNPYSGLGLPLAAEMQPGAFFLPFVLLLSLEHGLILQKVLLQALAGLATYALLRRLGLTRAAALLGGICYQLNGSFAWFADAPITPIAFLPLFLLGIEHALDAARTGRAGGWAAIGVAVGYSLYAGFPETAYLNGLLALAWAVLRWATEARGVRLGFLRKVAAGGLSGLLAAAPLLLPFAQFMAVADESPASISTASACRARASRPTCCPTCSARFRISRASIHRASFCMSGACWAAISGCPWPSSPSSACWHRRGNGGCACCSAAGSSSTSPAPRWCRGSPNWSAPSP